MHTPRTLAPPRVTYRSLGPGVRFLLWLPAVVGAAFAASAVPPTTPASLVLRVAVVFAVCSLVVVALTAALAVARPPDVGER